MSSSETAPGQVQTSEHSACDAISVTWVVRPGDTSVSSLPTNDIKAIWRNEVGDALCTPRRAVS